MSRIKNRLESPTAKPVFTHRTKPGTQAEANLQYKQFVRAAVAVLMAAQKLKAKRADERNRG